MELMEAIYNRRSVRFFTTDPVGKETIEKLINAGIQAPSAMNSQPWAFSVIQDKDLLQKISDDTKAYFLETLSSRPYMEGYRPLFSNPDYHIFYNAPTLLTVYAKPEGPTPASDCSLAAQNIMLAAHALGLGTCWMGFAQVALNTPALKEQFGIPDSYTVIAPLAIGHPSKPSSTVARKEPQILFWK